MGDAVSADIWDLSPVPTLVVSPSHRIQRVSDGLLGAWSRARDEFVGEDIFVALYGRSPLGRFDRIPFAHAISVATGTRSYRLCHSAYSAHGESWSARIIPIFRQDKLISLVLEWEVLEPTIHTTGIEATQTMVSTDEIFRLLINAVKDYAIFLLDTKGYVATWNAGAQLLKGYSKDDIIGKHFSSFYGEDDLQSGKPEEELQICLREGRVQDEGWRYRKDGSKFWANVVITAVYRNGVHVGFGKVTRDLTERRESEMRLIAAHNESAKLKDEFLANISHEIRNPMHGMLSANHLLLDSPLAKDQREWANVIADSGKVLLQVINGILDYSKLASGNFSMTSGLVGVASIISSVVRNVQVMLQPGVQVKLSLSPELPKSTQGDPLRFRQVIQNIMDNAAKFTERGWISVQSSVMEEDDTTYTILTEVTDTGTGITDAIAKSLFKPFTQHETAANKRFQGTGLGLSIAKSLAELMGGQLGYRPNSEYKGSVFWFSAKLNKVFSLEQLEAGERQVANGSDECQHDSRKSFVAGPQDRLRELGKGKRLLAVEDNNINQRVLVGMLCSLGLGHVDVASNGAQAVSMMNDSRNAYDVVLMDVSMPVMDGFEATTEIRKSGMQPPIIAMTAFALRGDREMCLEKGMDDYVPKPVDRDLLLRKLLNWLGPSDTSITYPSRVRVSS